MMPLRKIIGLFVLGTLLALTVLPALAHGGAQVAPSNTVEQFGPDHDINSDSNSN